MTNSPIERACALVVYDGVPCEDVVDALAHDAFDVRPATSVEEAFRIAYRSRVDVVVVDVPRAGSPVLDLFGRFRRDPMLRSLGLLATTSLHRDDLRRVGAHVVLHRPFGADLVSRAARILATPTRQR